MPETPTFGRYAEIPYDEMTPEQQEGYRFLVEVRGAAGGPSKIWVHNPKLTKASAPLGAHFHPGGYSLSEREREIAVIIINSKWHSAYPTAAHERRGKEVGLPAANGRSAAQRAAGVIRRRARRDRLRDGDLPVEFALGPQGLYDRAVKALGHVGITDVITLMGYYTSVSMTLAFYDVPPGRRGCSVSKKQRFNAKVAEDTQRTQREGFHHGDTESTERARSAKFILLRDLRASVVNLLALRATSATAFASFAYPPRPLR